LKKKGIEVPQIWSYNYIMEIKDKKGSWIKIEKGDVIGDGFEEGIVIDIRLDGAELEFGVSDLKEGWTINLRDVQKVNGDDFNIV
jgi:hypothetical protein